MESKTDSLRVDTGKSTSRPDRTPQPPNMNVDRNRNNEGGSASDSLPTQDECSCRLFVHELCGTVGSTGKGTNANVNPADIVIH